MLVLTRRIGERIIIGDDIVLEVLSISSGSQVSFGITAPKTISVHREEIYKKIKQEKEKEYVK